MHLRQSHDRRIVHVRDGQSGRRPGNVLRCVCGIGSDQIGIGLQGSEHVQPTRGDPRQGFGAKHIRNRDQKKIV